MRSLLVLAVLGIPVLAACQKASAAENTEMAQCAAAMGIEHEYLVHLSPPQYDRLAPLSAAIVYYKYRLRIAGVPDLGRAESYAFIAKNIRNLDMVGKMVSSCGDKLWAEPEFKANYEDLLRAGIESDPACKPDPARCRKP